MDSIKKEFPITESYRSAAGKNVEFTVNAEELPIGYSVTATETKNSKGKRIGYYFHVILSTLPEALWKIRDKIKKNLAFKYTDEIEGCLALTHDKLVGRITSSENGFTVIEVDGKELGSDKFWEIVSTYEGFEITVTIKEQ